MGRSLFLGEKIESFLSENNVKPCFLQMGKMSSPGVFYVPTSYFPTFEPVEQHLNTEKK